MNRETRYHAMINPVDWPLRNNATWRKHQTRLEWNLLTNCWTCSYKSGEFLFFRWETTVLSLHKIRFWYGLYCCWLLFNSCG